MPVWLISQLAVFLPEKRADVQLGERGRGRAHNRRCRPRSGPQPIGSTYVLFLPRSVGRHARVTVLGDGRARIDLGVTEAGPLA